MIRRVSAFRLHGTIHRLRLLVPAVVAFPVLIAAGVITRTLEFSVNDVVFSTREGYDVADMHNGIVNDRSGNPGLPHLLYYFLIPATAEVEAVELRDVTDMELGGAYRLFPVQEPFPISKPEMRRWSAPNPAVYASADLYPARSITASPSGSMCGFRIAGVDVAPLRYRPQSGKLMLTTRATIAVRYREGAHASGAISERQYRAFAPLAGNLVQNRADLSRFSPRVRPDAITDVNYAIVTDDTFKNGFEPFRLWKTKKGFRTEAFATSWIYANFSGKDNAEKVRNFLKDYHAKKGLVYVLLAGDYDKVPHRIVTTLDICDVASDYYFGDLDGTWDTNNDGKYGEILKDDIDGYYDILPGRLPLDNAGEVDVFIHKDTVMEKCPPAEGMKRQLLPSTPNFGTIHHGKKENNMIADSCSPGWFNAKLEDPSRNAVRDSLNKGFYMMHIHAHGAIDEFCGDKGNDPIFTVSDVGSLTNKTFTILYSVACHVGTFDSESVDCIGEALINKQNAGCVATILNTRYGISNSIFFAGNDYLSVTFSGMFFRRDTFTIAQTLAATKHTLREVAWKTGDHWSYLDPGDKDSTKGVSYRSHYCVNTWTLMGDPDLPIHKEALSPLSVSHPATVNTGKQTLAVTVSGSGAPLVGALVCCYKDGEVHATGRTDASGKAGISIEPATSGVMHVTVTARDRYPYEEVCAVGGIATAASANSPFFAAPVTVSRGAGGILTVQFVLRRRTPIEAALYGADGRLVKPLENRTRDPGVYRLPIDERALGTGVYFLKCKAGAARNVMKLIVAR